MNILYHHRTQGKGVEGIHIDELKKGLVALGHSVNTISPLEMNKSERDTGTPRTVPGQVYAYISRFTPEIIFEGLELSYNFVAYRNFKRQLQTKKYNLIYERYAIFNWAGVMAARKSRIPIILEINYTSFTPLYRRRSGLLLPLAHWVDRKIFQWADGFAVVSSFLKEHLISLGVDPHRIIVTPNAADTVRFNPLVCGASVRKTYGLENKKVIGFVGGFYPWHGLDLLLDAFLALRKEIPDAALLLGGDGPCREKLEKQVGELGLSADVIFTGKIDHAKLPEFIAAFDVAVMPDSNDYGSPMKIFEYMAMEKPVIAPRLGPLEDGIDDGEEGLLFYRCNRLELGNALITLLQNDCLRDRMGKKARKRVIERHTWQKNAESVVSLFDLVTGGVR